MNPDHINHFEDHEETGRAPEISSFPASVQAKLDKAQALLRHESPDDALDTLRRASAEFAKAAPELFALAATAHLGIRSVTREETDLTTNTVRTETFALGVRVGHRETTTTDSNIVRRTWRLG